MKEMVGGCCVCSDERGWDENPLVYCDGNSCNVAVHQACYGIVAVPSGPWFCRKCEASERSGRVRCELCPSRDGAFKKTDNGGWAHVVCALYIPEVRFENVSTMEPILISLIPQERYNKTCYICEGKEDKKEVRSMMGACMQCNKPGCKQHFHVTCAQMLGLLCEEAGNMMDNVKYCGYCEYHYSKLVRTKSAKSCSLPEIQIHKFTALDLESLPSWNFQAPSGRNNDKELWLNFQKKTSNLKIIPPFKPIPSGNNTDSPNSSPEKVTSNGRGPTPAVANHNTANHNTTNHNSTTPNHTANTAPEVSSAASTPHGPSAAPLLPALGENVQKSSGSSKSSSKKGKASSVSSASSNGSTTNSNNNPNNGPNNGANNAMPRIQIQPSNLFSSSSGFGSSYSTNLNSNNGILPTGRHKSRSKSRSPSALADDLLTVIKTEKISPESSVVRKARSFCAGGSGGGKSNDEDSKTDEKTDLNRRSHQGGLTKEGQAQGQEVNSSTGSFIPSGFGKLKELATVSMNMNELISSTIDNALKTAPSSSKFERSASLPTAEFNSSERSRIESNPKPLPEPHIVPHVTLTPIPMKPTDDSQSKVDQRSNSKSPGSSTFPSTFGSQQLGKHEVMDTEMATISLEKPSASPSKRMRMSLHHAPQPQGFDSDTESATEEWPEDSALRSQSNSMSMTPQKEHVSRREAQGSTAPTTSPRRMLTASQASEMSHWESRQSPTVSLERITHPPPTVLVSVSTVSGGVKEVGQGQTTSSSSSSFPFGSNSTYPLDLQKPRKRGPGRPSINRGTAGGTREDENRGKGPGGKRGRRGSVTNYGRRESGIPNGNSGGALEEPIVDKMEEEPGQGQGVNSSSRGGRQMTANSRKASSSAPTTVTTPVQNSPTPTATITRKPSYEDMNNLSRKGSSHDEQLSRKPSYDDGYGSRKPSYDDISRKQSYDDGPTLTMSQLKAQMASASASSSPEKSLAPSHMFGNALNPASSMAQRMVDTLSQEMETIGATSETPPETVLPTATPLVGISFPGKSSSLLPGTSAKPIANGVVTTNGPTAPNAVATKPQPQTLEELLERQWEQGSQFLMEQAQHLDISQLLSCLNQLKADNKALEDHVASLMQRKEQLTAINARLSIPLGCTNSLGLGLGFSGNRQETPPIPAIQAPRVQAPIPSAHAQHHVAQLQQQQQQQQQQEVVHQGRYSVHAHAHNHYYDPGAHAYQNQQQQHHRASSANLTSQQQQQQQQQQQMYGYGQSTSSSAQAQHLPPHHQPSRDNR